MSIIRKSFLKIVKRITNIIILTVFVFSTVISVQAQDININTRTNLFQSFVNYLQIQTNNLQAQVSRVLRLPTAEKTPEIQRIQQEITAIREIVGELQKQTIPQPSDPAVIPAHRFTRSLSLGSRGNDVLELQKRLNKAGFILIEQGTGSPGRETDYFGPLTQKALEQYQQELDLLPEEEFGSFGSYTAFSWLFEEISMLGGGLGDGFQLPPKYDSEDFEEVMIALGNLALAVLADPDDFDIKHKEYQDTIIIEICDSYGQCFKLTYDKKTGRVIISGLKQLIPESPIDSVSIVCAERDADGNCIKWNVIALTIKLCTITKDGDETIIECKYGDKTITIRLFLRKDDNDKYEICVDKDDAWHIKCFPLDDPKTLPPLPGKDIRRIFPWIPLPPLLEDMSSDGASTF